MIIELKWNKSSDGAIRQIKEKNYIQILEGYGSELLLAGISYDVKTKKHKCLIENLSTTKGIPGDHLRFLTCAIRKTENFTKHIDTPEEYQYIMKKEYHSSIIFKNK